MTPVTRTAAVLASATLAVGLLPAAASATVSGGTVILLDLPTADPLVAGQLWNSTGTVKVSAGE